MSFLRLERHVKELEDYCAESGHRVLSLYLNTEPDRNRPQSWKIKFKSGMKRLREYAEAEGGEEQVKMFDHLRPSVEHAVEEMRGDLKKGLLLFACSSGQFTVVETVQVPTPDAFYWEDRPHMQELQEMMKTYPPAGLVQAGSDGVSVISTSLGEIVDEWHYEWDIQQDRWRQKKGLGHAGILASSANHRDQYDKKLDVNRQRWLKDFVPVLESHTRKQKWKEIILTGEPDVTSDLVGMLNTKSRQRIIPKNFNGMPSAQLLQEVHSNLR
ncbi:VLRF1 family aeRF1-type release factor [Paenibacillus tarimensis]|uniref:VLRF1 family aeRF1-type release factor n=1 Tax=Paenibacillus tarimensis TaxID=416012 RepID=UPI001F1E987E|nr:VLRF1 family aeRF1-type release factor [Paenibacillus tarimensis]